MIKKIFFSLTVVISALCFTACSSDDHDDSGSAPQKDIEARATALGFDNVQSYQSYVTEHCKAGNHENCDIQTNGVHSACGYKEHSGTKHNGQLHNGTNHGTHDANGNHHHNGNQNGGGHHH